MARSKYEKYRVFPFAPGIRWEMGRGRVVLPKIDPSVLNNRLNNKKITVCAFGGLIESALSFCILEMLNYFAPSSDLYWAGYENFYPFLKMNGLAKEYKGKINKSLLKKYPVPLFFNKNDDVYFNCLNNYIYVYNYYRKKSYHNTKAASKQLIDNGLFKWEDRFLPKLRNLDFCNKKAQNYIKLLGVNLNQPFALFICEKTNYSIYDVDCLGWYPTEIRSLSAILGNYNMPVVVLSNDRNAYRYGSAHVLPFNFELYFYLMLRANCVFSRDIDFLFLTMMFSNAKIFSLAQPEELKIGKNAKFLKKDNVIYTSKEMNPVDVCEKILMR